MEIITNFQDVNRITLNWRSTNTTYNMTFNYMSSGIVAETTLTGIPKQREDVYLMVEFKNGLRINSTTHLISMDAKIIIMNEINFKFCFHLNRHF